MKIHVLDTSEGAEALKQYELSKYTTLELIDEIRAREQPENESSTEYWHDMPEQHQVCEHNMEMGYCQVKECEGGL